MPEHSRTLEVHCRNCGARFVAWYGEEDVATEVKEVRQVWPVRRRPFQEGRPEGHGVAADSAVHPAER